MKGHYAVLSPDRIQYAATQGEPAERGRDYVTVIAPNARAAKALALKTPEYAGWLSDCRSDGVNPFIGLTTSFPVCDHGACYCDDCIAADEWTDCAGCELDALRLRIAEELA